MNSQQITEQAINNLNRVSEDEVVYQATRLIQSIMDNQSRIKSLQEKIAEDQNELKKLEVSTIDIKSVMPTTV